VPAAKEASAPIHSVPRRPLVRLLIPSLGDFFFLTVLVILFVVSTGGWQQLLADGDTGWHIRNGDWILRNHRVPQSDLFSYSKPGAPWFAWEWLADVVFAWAHARQGLKGVVIVSGLLICSSVLILFRYMLWRGAGIAWALLLSVLVADASQIHYLARPHLFTLVLLPICLWLLDRDRQRPSAAVWILVPIAALWANLHGGFLVLFVSLALWIAGAFLRGRVAAVRRPLVLTGACLLATLVNPYGYRLHVHIAQYLRSDWIAGHVNEFLPPEIRSEGMYKFEALLFVGIGLVGYLVHARKYEDGFLVAFWAHESLQSARHVPIYMMAAAPVIGTELAAFVERSTRGRPRASLPGVVRELVREFSVEARRSSIWLPVLAAILWWMPAGPRWPSDFPDKFPAAIVNRNLATLAPARGPSPRLVSSDEWGGYLIYRLYPATPVFMDGRSDFYGPEIGNDYVCLMRACGKWSATLEKWRFDWALLPRDWALVELLKSRPDWRVVDQDKTAILLQQTPQRN